MWGWDELGWTGLGWSGPSSPQESNRGGDPSPDPAIGQVPGELSDRCPAVAIREAEEGDGLKETFLLLLLALQQVLTLDGSDVKSQGDGGPPLSPGMGWDSVE